MNLFNVCEWYCCVYVYVLCLDLVRVEVRGECRGQRRMSRTLDLESQMLKRYCVSSGSDPGPLQE